MLQILQLSLQKKIRQFTSYNEALRTIWTTSTNKNMFKVSLKDIWKKIGIHDSIAEFLWLLWRTPKHYSTIF